MSRNQLKKRLVSVVFPANCCICQALLPSVTSPKGSSQADFCKSCLGQLADPQADRCPKCGAEATLLAGGERCALCLNPRLSFSRSFSIGNYRGLLKREVLRMKRQHDERLAFQFGQLLGNTLQKMDLPKINLITPIPTHWWHRLKNGFHAADIIGDGLHQVTQIPKADRLLKCARRTAKQGQLSIPQRFANRNGAFRLGTRNVKGLSILVVDDVMTSGATAAQATNVLLEAGAERVYMAVVARGAGVS